MPVCGGGDELTSATWIAVGDIQRRVAARGRQRCRLYVVRRRRVSVTTTVVGRQPCVDVESSTVPDPRLRHSDRCRRTWEPAGRNGDAMTIAGCGGVVDVTTTWRQRIPSRDLVTSSAGACPVAGTAVTSARAKWPTSWSHFRQLARYLVTIAGGSSECRREEFSRRRTLPAR